MTVEKSSAAKICIQPLTRRTQAYGDHRSCRFPARISEALVRVRKQRTEQREILKSRKSDFLCEETKVRIAP